MILGDPDEKELETAARITARYGDGRRNPPVTIALRRNGTEQTVEVVPADDEEIDGYRLSGS